jgi:acetyltransferase-like isoleucine patch superfamily enzyme
MRYPGLAIDPSVNCRIEGRFEYGDATALAEGANLIVPAGAVLRIGAGCYVGRYVELGPLGVIEIGDRSSIQDRSILVGDVSVGRYCMLSLNVLMTSGTHYYERWPHLLIRDQDRLVGEDPTLRSAHSRRIRISEDCWFGMNAVVMPGISIARGCVIGTNAVVTRDLQPYSVAAGAPARVIKHRMSFKPPRRIDWREAKDLPYFYAGFELALDERGRNERLGGHVAMREFALWLDGQASELVLRARSRSGSVASISSNGVQAVLHDQWKECRFPAGPPEGPAEFAVSDDAGGVILSEAWLA